MLLGAEFGVEIRKETKKLDLSDMMVINLKGIMDSDKESE
jgi:hypothetical protein